MRSREKILLKCSVEIRRDEGIECVEGDICAGYFLNGSFLNVMGLVGES